MDMTRKRYNNPKKARIVVEKCPVDSTGKPCHCHREGQVFEFDFERCPSDFCAAALFPSLYWPGAAGSPPHRQIPGPAAVRRETPSRSL